MRSSDVPSKLFVAGLGDNRKADLSRVFSKYGEVLSVYVDEKKQFGFVEYSSSNEAQQALEHVNHMKVNGSRLRVEYARSEKGSRDNRRSPSRDRDRQPTAHVYDRLQVTANRLPTSMPGPAYRQNYYPYPHSSMMMGSSAAMSRGRSLTPPSLKQSGRMGAMPTEFYAPYHHGFYMDPSYYRPYDDPFAMQRLNQLPSRSYGNPYASSEFARYSSTNGPHRRSRSRSRDRRRNSPGRRNRSSREQKPKRKQSRSPSPVIVASRDRSHRSRKRSRSGSSPPGSTPEQKPSSPSTEEEDEKSSNYRNSQDNNSNQKYSKRRRNE